MTANVNPLHSVALSAALKTALDSKDRDLVGPGVHKNLTLDLTVQIAELRIGEDTDKVPTCAIPMIAAMALLVKRMGFQREKALEVIKDVMRDALTLQKDAEAELLAESGVKEAEAEIKQEVLAKLPRTPVKGAVKAKGVNIEFKD